MVSLFTNKNKEIRSGFKIALFAFIYLILSGLIGQILFNITYGIMSRNKYLNTQQLYNQVNRYLYNTESGALLMRLLGFMVLLFTIFVLLRGLDNKKFKDIGFNSIKYNKKELIGGLILGAASMSVIFIVLLISGNLKLKYNILQPNFTTNVLWGLALYIIVALNEELMCRGYIQTILNQMQKPWLSAVITSAIFSALHLGNPNVKTVGLINIFLVGLLFSYMYIRTKSLWMPIGYHLTWNYFQGSVFGFPVSGTTQSKGIYNIESVKENILTGGSFGPEAGILTTIVIMIGIAVVWKMTRASR